MVGNTAKGRISERVFQENNTPNFPKNENFLPSDTHMYVVHQGVSRKIWSALIS